MDSVCVQWNFILFMQFKNGFYTRRKPSNFQKKKKKKKPALEIHGLINLLRYLYVPCYYIEQCSLLWYCLNQNVHAFTCLTSCLIVYLDISVCFMSVQQSISLSILCVLLSMYLTETVQQFISYCPFSFIQLSLLVISHREIFKSLKLFLFRSSKLKLCLEN